MFLSRSLPPKSQIANPKSQMPIMVDHKVGGVDRLAVSRLLRDAIEPEVGRATVVTRPPIYIVPHLSILQPLFLSMEIN